MIIFFMKFIIKFNNMRNYVESIIRLSISFFIVIRAFNTCLTQIRVSKILFELQNLIYKYLLRCLLYKIKKISMSSGKIVI